MNMASSNFQNKHKRWLNTKRQLNGKIQALIIRENTGLKMYSLQNENKNLIKLHCFSFKGTDFNGTLYIIKQPWDVLLKSF